MTKTFSLPVCRKLSEMGIEVASDFWWKYYPHTDGYVLAYAPEGMSNLNVRAYQLDELPVLLRAISEKNKDGDYWKIHWLAICSLYAQSGSLGEGSEASKYLEGLL